MITGYNTDVRYNDVIYHVQTEDKGLANPFIESLLYVGGQILANKRTSYAELLSEGKGERAILAMMDHQHRTMIAAIRAGKFDKRLAALRGTGPVASPEGGLVTPPTPVPVTLIETNDETLAAPAERSLDQVILDYLTVEAEQEQLVLEVSGEDELAAGQLARLSLQALSSKSGKGVAGARVLVKFLSTTSGPAQLAIGDTDAQGSLVLEFDVPPITRGTAALIVTAASAIGQAEFKHLL